jgi:roadblock/LC7 domain-containing protein
MSDKANAAADQAAAVPQPGTPEHDAAMAAKFDAANQAAVTPEAPVRPEHVPEKFWNAETGVIDTAAWAQSYKELEQKQSQAKPVEGQQAPVEGANGAATDDAAKAALESKGLKLDDFSAEFQKSGALSEDSYQKLEAAGIPKPMVDAYIAGQQALAAQVQAQGFEAAGGKEQFEQMVKWAATGLTPGEIAAYDAAVTGGSVDQMKLAVAGLRASYEAANGREPGLLGGKPGSGNAPGYASRAEMTTDMKDPRYGKDPAFRAKVEAKLAATTAF